jgi:hypothetical protein
MSSFSFYEVLSNISKSHDRLKHAVHTRFRMPIHNKYGRWAMGFVYMTIPVVGGYYVMQWAIHKSHESIGERGERLPVKTVQGLGDKRIASDGSVQTVGAGGLGGGVHLSVSTEEEQRRNRRKLEKFLQKTLKSPSEKTKEGAVQE